MASRIQVMELQRVEYHQKIREHLSSAYLLTDERIEAVLPRFLETLRKLMSELEGLSANDKNDALSRTGHAMKGALLNLGLHDLAEKAFSIEKYNQGCGDNRDCSQLIEELKREIGKIL